MSEPFRLCVVGNSHVAAVKLGWDQIAADYPDVEMTFFAKPSDSLADMITRGRRVTLSDPVGRRYLKRTFGFAALDVREIDAFLCVGMLAAMHTLMKMQADHKLAGQAGEAAQFVSEGAYAAAFGDEFNAALIAHVLATLKEAGARRGLFTPDPLVSAAVLEEDKRANEAYQKVVERGEGPLFARLLERAIPRLLPEGFEYLAQPADMTVNEVLTLKEYSVGSVRLRSGAEHPEQDNRHMNADYGARILRAAFDRLGVAPSGSVQPTPVKGAAE